jgi:arylsulfatase A-like enzyme
MLDALIGKSSNGRDHLVEHSSQTNLRQGHWKLIPANRGAKFNKATGTELGNDTTTQLYDLAADPGEQKDLSKERPEQVSNMQIRLQKIRDSGYSRPGFQPQPQK